MLLRIRAWSICPPPFLVRRQGREHFNKPGKFFFLPLPSVQFVNTQLKTGKITQFLHKYCHSCATTTSTVGLTTTKLRASGPQVSGIQAGLQEISTQQCLTLFSKASGLTDVRYSLSVKTGFHGVLRYCHTDFGENNHCHHPPPPHHHHYHQR